MKFKIGDKVRVTKKYEVSPAGKHEYGWAKKMDESVGRVYTVRYDDFDGYGTYQLDNGWYYLPESLELVEGDAVSKPIDAHYSFDYALTEDDKKSGKIKIDPYFVAKQWSLGSKDDTGVLFHCLKNISRYSDKNTKQREITALHLQIKRLAELEGVVLP